MDIIRFIHIGQSSVFKNGGISLKSSWKIFHRLLRKIHVSLDAHFKLPKVDKTKNTIFVFGVSSQVNYGDLAISLAQQEFIERNFNNYNYIEILDYQTKSAVNIIKNIIDPQDIVMVSGGGNFGNLYNFSENNRKIVVETFKNNKIISFPQSMYYTEDKAGKDQLEKDIEFYEAYPNFVLTARESLSYKKMKENFYNRVLFCPDIVLSLEIPEFKAKRDGILAIMRDDKERLNQNSKKELLNKMAEIHKIKFSDNNIPSPKIIKKEKRKKVVLERLKVVESNEVVITDRLHGMLFSFITNTPCIVFNNANSKVKYSYLNWLRGNESICFAEELTIDEIMKWYKKISTVNIKPNDQLESFGNFIEFIKK